MLIEDFLQKFRLILQNDIESTQNICEIVTSNRDIYTQEYLSKISNSIKSKKETDSNNLCLEKVSHFTEELETALKEAELKAAQFEQQIAILEKKKERLISNKDDAQYRTKLDNVKAILKCSKALFPAEFDYSQKNITGFMCNTHAETFCAFELPPQNSTSNSKYAWKHLEKLFD